MKISSKVNVLSNKEDFCRFRLKYFTSRYFCEMSRSTRNVNIPGSDFVSFYEGVWDRVGRAPCIGTIDLFLRFPIGHVW